MDGLMMHRPLRIADILTFAEDTNGQAEVVSSTVEGGRHRYTYWDMAARCRKLANALEGIGVRHGDRVATLAWT